MSTATSSIFTGSSQFSSDFQTVIQNAVQFASLPMQLTQNDVAALQSQSSELSTLNSDFRALQAAIGGLNSALGLGSYAASASPSATGTTLASVTLSGTPGVGTYSLEIDGVGAHASAMSSDGTTVADPTKSTIGNATKYTLTAGGKTVTVIPASATLSALTAAINQAGAGVTATMVNVGSNAAPDYRLSLQATALADATIQLTAYNSSTGLLSPGTTGAPATYRVNGKPTNVLSSDSPTITIAPGVSATMQAVGTTTITVSQNTNAVSNALSSFVSAYNTVQSEIAKNHGQGTGALQGQSVLLSLSQTLSGIANYSTGYNGISSLTSLGLSFDAMGVMSFNATTFGAATAGQIQQLSTFLGSTTTGGFLKTANDALTGIADSSSGILQSAIQSVQNGITRDNNTINAQQARVLALQTQLTQQMAKADAAIASVEQQYSYLSEMYQQMDTNARMGG
jgi:flagellar hook-associated protein 2